MQYLKLIWPIEFEKDYIELLFPAFLKNIRLWSPEYSKEWIMLEILRLASRNFKGQLHLVMSLNMGYLLYASVAWNGECIGDTLWPSLWSMSDSHAWSVYATILDHLDCNCNVISSNLCFRCTDFEAVGTWWWYFWSHGSIYHLADSITFFLLPLIS